MKYYYLTFRSITPAQRGERVLKSSGFHCALQRTPKWMENQGCGYCLRLPEQEVYRAIDLLSREDVPLRRVFVQRGDGKMEEIGL